MTKYIVKREGNKQEFDAAKITRAIRAAFDATAAKKGIEFPADAPQKISDDVVAKFSGMESVAVEQVQDAVEETIASYGYFVVAKAYILYRQNRAEQREVNKGVASKAKSIFKETDKLNANISNGPAGKMLQLGELMASEYARKFGLPSEFMDAHDGGDIHIHDLGWLYLTYNCLHIPVKRLLETGFDAGHGFIRPPKNIRSAAALVAILIQSSQNDMFGGQSVPSFDTALAKFAGKDVPESEIAAAMKGLVYNLNSMHSRAGAQVPFSSLNVGLDTSEAGRRITRNLLLEYEKGLGKGENPIFPNIIFKVKTGVNRFKGDPNYDLFKLAMKVAARRMNPTFCFQDTSFNRPYGNVETMGCRTRVVTDVNGENIGEGRGNLFFVSLNLPRLALMAKGDIQKFYALLDEKMDLCGRQLLNRYDIVKNFRVCDLPFVLGQKLYVGSENLKPEDTIEEVVKHGTLAMGFIGLAETLVALTGKHHGESESSLKLGLEIVSHMKDYMDGMTKRHHLNFSLFATPAEGLSGRFVKMDKARFGSVAGVTDRDYYTNSFHVPVHYHISHFNKIAIEGQFHKLCLGGHISYVEYDAPPVGNLVAIEKELNHMADSDVGYAGINFPIDFCADCGYQSVINEDECPICGGHHIKRIRRVTGYLSDIENFNDGKKAEAHDRTTC